MQSKPHWLLKIGTVVFAISMLATYVVYSQKQRARVSPLATKAPATNAIYGPARTAKLNHTNGAGTPKTFVVAPSSKVRAPLLEIPPRKAIANSSADSAKVKPEMIASGSKSAPVFDLRQQRQSPQPKVASSPPPRHTTNVTLRPAQWPAH